MSHPAAASEPGVRLLDAGERGLDEAGLRAWARAETAARHAPYVSRSYRFPFAMIAWHGAPVGVDIERVEPFDAEFHASICTASERGVIPSGVDRASFVTSLWSSKEALSKALGDALAYDPRRLESPVFWPDGVAGAWRARALPAPPGHNAWLCWRAAEPIA